ncbi:hypothetical protein [Nocardioides convexus]|uniref:hypothetical protein n=1 Tax=Nocardioides convexus TaxID=2712224 RepID=UPI00310170BE
MDPTSQSRYDALVTRRAAREPLQHLTGTAAFRYVEVAVGPGVFVPRPETEPAGGLGGRPGSRGARGGGDPGRGGPVHRLRGDRAQPRRRGARGPGARRRAWTRPRTPGPSGTSPAPVWTCARATWPRRSTTSRGRCTCW